MMTEPTLLEQITRDYKLFKSVNESKVARIPQGLKERVKSAVDGGISKNALAASMGISVTAVQRWIDSLDMNPIGHRKRERPVLLRIKDDLPQGKPCEDVEKPQSKHQTPEWVRLRIAGRELEIS
jgi:hypothetical protein